MVYNGEIYNFKEFYPELKTNGFEIRTGSDTEVLLKLFQLHGSKMLHRLNGMFAFAIWDKDEKRINSCQGSVWVLNLCIIHFTNESFYFASEQKALFSAGSSSKSCPRWT